MAANMRLRGACAPARQRTGWPSIEGLLHTCLGVYYAALLREQNVDHIHVTHGYFGSWIAMVAARCWAWALA